jgi:long-chain acyl-CoA synthetase
MALHATVAEKWRAITGRPLIEGYGLTEASPVVACNSYEAPALGSVGLPLPSTEIGIREGNVEVPAGESGELCVRGPQVMRGYWNRREETAMVLTADSWLRTGDIAVLECGCIGVPDARSGQAVKIFVVLREGSSLAQEELLVHCRERLTGYKVPKYLEFRASLPKTNVGKVLRRALAEEQSSRAA